MTRALDLGRAYLVARRRSDGVPIYLGEDGEEPWPLDRGAARVFVSEGEAMRAAAREPGAYVVDVEPIGAAD